MECYFASLKNFDGQTLYPRIPKHRMERENNCTERICVSQSISGCLSALSAYAIDDTVYIYKCISNNIVQPSLEEVPDRYMTGELWITEPVIMHLFRKAIITAAIKNVVDGIYNIVYSFELMKDITELLR